MSRSFRALTTPTIALTLVLSAVAPASAHGPAPSVRSVYSSAQAIPVDRPTVTASRPAAPAAPTARRRATSAVVTWRAPADHGSALTGYVVTPYRNGKRGRAVSFDASNTVRTVSGLTPKGSYTFTVAARNAVGTGPASARSAVAPMLSLPSAPAITAVTADTASALLSWQPGSDGGSPVLGYHITPYIGGVRGAADVVSTATTNTITGLIPSTTYRFTVAAYNAMGTGPESALSVPVTANASPTLSFPTPPAPTINISYVANLVITHGHAPFVWSVLSGALPPGLGLDPNNGALSGVPALAGSFPFVLNVLDAAGQTGSRLVTLVVGQGPSLAFPAPPLGEVGASYSDSLTVLGGVGPFTWSIDSGTLPPGLTLAAGTGLLSGRPTTTGQFLFTVKVRDANLLTAAQGVRMTIQPASLVTLTAATSTTTFGTAVSFSVSIGPGLADGTVIAIDQAPNGAATPLGSFPVVQNAAYFTIVLPAFGLNRFRVEYDGATTHAVADSNPVNVDVAAVKEQVTIDQFAQSGLDGLTDQYVTLINTTGLNLDIAGFKVEAPGGVSVTVPASARPLPPRRGYLIAGAGYVLATITPDLVVPTLGQGGLRVVAPDTAGTVVDVAGSTPGFYDGTPLPAFTSPPLVDYAWVRHRYNGQPVDTGNDAADFTLVATVLGPINGVPSALGSPSPQNSLGTYQQNGAMQSSLLDPAVAANASPNLQMTGTTVTIRRTITNRAATPITQARIRITALSQLNGAPRPGGPLPQPPHGNLRLVNPASLTSAFTITGGQAVTVRNLTLDLPATDPPGAGLSTTLSIPLTLGGVAPGGTVSISLTFAIDTVGPYWVGYDVDALGGGAAPAAGPLVAGGAAAADAAQFAIRQRTPAPCQLVTFGAQSR